MPSSSVLYIGVLYIRVLYIGVLYVGVLYIAVLYIWVLYIAVVYIGAHFFLDLIGNVDSREPGAVILGAVLGGCRRALLVIYRRGYS